jgi:hypothetical protein
MPKSPTDDPEFKRVLGNLLKAKPKPHADMRLGKAKPKKKKSLDDTKPAKRRV